MKCVNLASMSNLCDSNVKSNMKAEFINVVMSCNVHFIPTLSYLTNIYRKVTAFTKLLKSYFYLFTYFQNLLCCKLFTV